MSIGPCRGHRGRLGDITSGGGLLRVLPTLGGGQLGCRAGLGAVLSLQGGLRLSDRGQAPLAAGQLRRELITTAVGSVGGVLGSVQAFGVGQ